MPGSIPWAQKEGSIVTVCFAKTYDPLPMRRCVFDMGRICRRLSFQNGIGFAAAVLAGMRPGWIDEEIWHDLPEPVDKDGGLYPTSG